MTATVPTDAPAAPSDSGEGNTALGRVAQLGLATAGLETACAVALAVWHEQGRLEAAPEAASALCGLPRKQKARGHGWRRAHFHQLRFDEAQPLVLLAGARVPWACALRPILRPVLRFDGLSLMRNR